MKITMKDAGKVRILDLRGRIDFAKGTEDLRKALNRLLEEGQSRIVLNLGDVDWIDTSGVGCLVESKKRAVDKKGDIALIIPQEKQLTPGANICLRLAFKIFENELKAIGSF